MLMSVNKKIHPTYIQKILSDKRYKPDDYQMILKSLAKIKHKKIQKILIN